MNKNIIAMALSGFGLALSGCVGADPGVPAAPAPAAHVSEAGDGNALLRLDVESGHSVTFYEPTPGGLFLVERKAPAQKFVLGDKEAANALAAFARLRPHDEVPAALRAAYDHARNLEASAPVEPATAIGGGAPASELVTSDRGVAQPQLTSSPSGGNFVANDGGCDWGPEFSFCRVEWANGFFASRSPTTSGLCVVDHYSGNGVTVQITVGGTVSSSFQGVGTAAQYSLGTAGGGTTRRIDILNASGDSFHVGCRWGV